jgi:hypothetical protein
MVFIVTLCALGMAQEHPNGFFLTSPLGLSSGYDDNFVAGSQKLDDIVSLLNAPAFTWMRSTHRTNLSVDYQPEFEFFARQPDLNAWNHASTFRLLHQVNSVVSVDGGNLFLSTMDPSRRLANSLLLLPRGRYFANSAYSGLGFRMNAQTKLSFRVDNAVTTMDLKGPMAGRLDQVTTAGTVTLDRRLTSRQKVSGSYSFLHVIPTHPELWGSPTNVHLVVGGYNYDINPGLLVHFSAGVVHGSDNSFTGAVAVEKKLGDVWIAAAYQRYLSFFGGVLPLAGAPTTEGSFADGLTPASVYQVVGVRAWGKLSRRIGVEASVQRALNGLDPQFHAVKGVIAQLRTDYRLTPRLVVFARAEHYAENINMFTAAPYSRNRYFGGIEIALFRARETENPRNKHGKTPQDSRPVPAGELPATEDNLP